MRSHIALRPRPTVSCSSARSSSSASRIVAWLMSGRASAQHAAQIHHGRRALRDQRVIDTRVRGDDHRQLGAVQRLLDRDALQAHLRQHRHMRRCKRMKRYGSVAAASIASRMSMGIRACLVFKPGPRGPGARGAGWVLAAGRFDAVAIAHPRPGRARPHACAPRASRSREQRSRRGADESRSRSSTKRPSAA